MTASVKPRVRFAPSPTGHVHIGNIRAAIFNWLFARHEGGTFLLRVEDTDLERSTQAAIQTLLESMAWLGLSYDEEIVYQTHLAPNHHLAAERLRGQKDAYFGKSDDGGSTAPLYFRIPWDVTRFPCVRKVGHTTLELHPDVPAVLDATGMAYAQCSRKGKPSEEKATLAGFRDLVLKDAEGKVLFELEGVLDRILDGEIFTIEKAVRAEFTRHEVFYVDAVKGELAKPLDTIRDFVIVRSNGSPVFHLANVCDDITQNITHIIRGDDHVENTYRHLFLFYCLGAIPPTYAHLPMIVNHEGKPYSKRDGDAFVGDFKTKGYLAAALFNYLTLLGWAPGDDREKMSLSELVDAFSLDRCSSSPAHLDMVKLQNLNGQYLAEMSDTDFRDYILPYAQELLSLSDVDMPIFNKTVNLMHSRTRYGSQVSDWVYFFDKPYPMDEKSLTKALSSPGIREGLTLLVQTLPQTTSPETVETAIRAAEQAVGLSEGKLNQPLRLCVTGVRGGADLIETLSIIGTAQAVKRLQTTIG